MAIAERLTNVSKSLRALQFRLTQRLLFTWIRPTFLGNNAAELGLSDDDLVCYVLPFQSIADLFVIERACLRGNLPLPTQPIEPLGEERAFFFQGHPEGWFGRKSQRTRSERMLRLLGHTSKPVKFVPVSLFWGHQPDREKSLFKLLLSENWSVTTRMKKFLSIVFHRHHILVQFSEPFELVDIVDGDENPEIHVRKLSRLLRTRFNHQKQAIIGPDLSHRRTLINTMMEAESVQEAILKESRKNDKNLSCAQKQALSYANEIASDQSYRVIRFFHVLLTWLWNNLYDGIAVNNIDRLKSAARENEIVYIPCHRSHIDYLLLSYVLYHNGLTCPHIAAGKNLNLPIVGSLLRRAGAFYMRRSFQGDALYKAVFDEYLHQMFTKGYSVEYFIEGGRSRTGRTLIPRTGMLSMTMRSFQKDSSTPICLMPVYFGYERVLESTSYMSELTGKEKKTESIFDVFRIFNSFKYSFGEVTVNFGEPLLLSDFMNSTMPGWAEKDDHPGFSSACVALSRELATRINSAAAVTAVGLTATAVLSTPRQTIEKRHLIKQIELLQTIAQRSRFSNEYSVADNAPESLYESAREITGLIELEQPFGTIVTAPPQLAVLLTYYRNNIAHLFAIPSLVARYLVSEQEVSEAALVDFCERLIPFLRTEFFIRDTYLTQACRTTIEILKEAGLVSSDRELLKVAEEDSGEFAALSELGEVIEPTLERFYIVLMLLDQSPEKPARALESDAHAIAQQLSAIYGINSPDFFEKPLFANFLNTLRREGALDTGQVTTSPLPGLLEASSQTLPADVQYNVRQIIKSLNKHVEAA